jgi:aconitate hydratase
LIKLHHNGVYLVEGKVIIDDTEGLTKDQYNQALSREGISPVGERPDRNQAKTNTIAYQILTKHNLAGDWRNLKIRFDALASHDITYVGIIQTARASGLKEFPVPYVLTNCHNSLCAVGGTINEDDHVFGLSAARKYGGIFVPAHQAVIHQYMREMMSGCGKMILGSDSHTRYGALGTMGIGEGGPELVKQLLSRTYDIAYPEVVAVYLEGQPVPGVGPQDVALAIIKAVFQNGFVKNKIMEFVGPGIHNLSVDYRNGIDVMTTETTCLSSIWVTDQRVEEYFRVHGRPESYARLGPGAVSYYDGLIRVDLSRIEPMIALPFHPSNAFPIAEFNRNAGEILKTVEEEGQKQLDNQVAFHLADKLVGGRFKMDQGVVAGCAGGTFENIVAMADILGQGSIGVDEFALSVYPASQPVNLQLIKNGAIEKLLAAGVTLRTAFCGPCFGAGDVPANNGISARHSTRNFLNREGSKPSGGQLASVALMDARSIAATSLHGGFLTPATEVKLPASTVAYTFNKQVYDNRVFQGFQQAQTGLELKFGPNIADWPQMNPLPENLLLQLVSVIRDPVTTTDELIPSGETSSYRSNPYKLAEFTLSRKDPGYVGRAKRVNELESERRRFVTQLSKVGIPDGKQLPVGLQGIFAPVVETQAGPDDLLKLVTATGLGSVIFATKPGDGSAREQAASCQKVLGGLGNIAIEYATKRYRSNLINWGMLPFTVDSPAAALFAVDDFIFIPGIRRAVKDGGVEIPAYVINSKGKTPITLKLANLSPDERDIILAGCLINYYSV